MSKNVFVRFNKKIALLVLMACLVVACSKGDEHKTISSSNCGVCPPNLFAQNAPDVGWADIIKRANLLAGDYSYDIKYTLKNHPEYAAQMPARLRTPAHGRWSARPLDIKISAIEQYKMKNPIRYLSRIRCDFLTVKTMKAVNQKSDSHVRMLWVMNCEPKIIYKKYILTVNNPADGGRFTLENPMFFDGMGNVVSRSLGHASLHNLDIKYTLETAIKKYEAERAGR
jgi:hypothetical protein